MKKSYIGDSMQPQSGTTIFTISKHKTIVIKDLPATRLTLTGEEEVFLQPLPPFFHCQPSLFNSVMRYHGDFPEL
jgi:hypothetical protein